MSIIKSVDMKLAAIVRSRLRHRSRRGFCCRENITSEDELGEVLAQLEVQMREAAKKFEFERAAALRDRIRTLKQRELGGFFAALAMPGAPPVTPAPAAPTPAAAAAADAPAARPTDPPLTAAPAQGLPTKPKAKRA